MKKGKVKITATAANGKKTVVTVYVVSKKLAVKSVSITKPLKSLKKGATKVLKGKLTPSKATGTTGALIKWKSSKSSVLSVNAVGKLTAKKKGTAKITMSAGGKKKTVTIKVKNNYW